MIPDDKRWLNYIVDGESLLENSDKVFIEDIFLIAETEAESRFKGKPGNDDDINEKLCVVKENLLRIVERLKLCKEAKSNFIRRYPNWHALRTENVKLLLALGTSMHKHRQNCNVSRLVGNCTSLVGGGITVASAALIPFTLGISTPLAVAGGTLTAVGSATSVGTSITEITLLKKKVEEASKILEEDKHSLQELQEWLEHANDLSKAIESLSSIDIEKDTVNVLQNFVAIAVTIQDSVQRNQIIKDFVLYTFDHLQLNASASALLVSRIVGLIGIIVLLYNNNNKLFKNAYKTISIVDQFVRMVIGVSGNVMQIASTVIKTDVRIATEVGKSVTRGVLAAFGMFLDIASIALTSIDVQKGSLCEKGEEIIQIASKLKEEADAVATVFDELIEYVEFQLK